ncbi:unnamed protein product [Allacma fusca]|uniref:Nicastrin n=1 Tax=Allacma fusca TaxID=39272 RepID=A0A8J2NVZ2_9HEXA|nr:unnamed protein product [Allacma fusca]
MGIKGGKEDVTVRQTTYYNYCPVTVIVATEVRGCYSSVIIGLGLGRRFVISWSYSSHFSFVEWVILLSVEDCYWVENRSVTIRVTWIGESQHSEIFALMDPYQAVQMNERTTHGDRTNTKIYEPVTGALACFRRMNKTHQIGCSSKLTGNVGVLHLVDSDDALNWVSRDGPHSPYIVLVYADRFVNRTTMIQLRDSGRVSGVLLLNSKTLKLDAFSEENTCPNRGYGLYTDPKDPRYCEPWNSKGNGLLYEEWDFPIFYVTDPTQVESLTGCFSHFNEPVNGTARDWPLCAAQLQSHMLAAVDSETCIRRENVFSLQPSRICDPMGGRNVWGSLFARSQQQPYSNNSVIVIGARLDSSSMFDQLTPGADSAVTALVAFLETIRHLTSVKNDLLASKTIENVYFMLFSGEAFDYIGSSRIVFDMKSNRFPFSISDSTTSQPAILKLENIKYFIEFNQVALKGKIPPYYVHSLNADGFFTEIQNQGQKIDRPLKFEQVKIEKDNKNSQGLPPSSVHSFVTHRDDLPGVVITNHNSSYRNMFHNSIYDSASAINYEYSEAHNLDVQGKIATLSATVARTIVSLANLPSEEIINSIVPDVDYVDELLHCYLEAGNCLTFQHMIGHDQLPSDPFPTYVGVYNNLNPLAILTQNLLSTYQGVKVSKDLKECKRNYDNQTVEYVWINETCYETTVNWSLALSPAFETDGRISWSEWNSGMYSTWTESVWQKFTVRIFLKPSRTHEILTIVFGALVCLLSFIVIGWVSKKSDVIFPSRPDGIC